MSKIYILCVDDEPYVLDAVVRDLSELEDFFPVETASSADDARQVIKEVYSTGDKIGIIICDHVMPGVTGVDLLIEMQNDPNTSSTRKVLLTGQAGLEETIEAINKAKLNGYIGKPWKPSELSEIVRDELATYIISQQEDILKYMKVLNVPKLQEFIRMKGYL